MSPTRHSSASLAALDDSVSLLFGAIASLVVSPPAVPLIYHMTHAGRHATTVAPIADNPHLPS